jgi:hypothetical protein
MYGFVIGVFFSLGSLRLRLLNSLRHLGAIIGVIVSCSLSSNDATRRDIGVTYTRDSTQVSAP